MAGAVWGIDIGKAALKAVKLRATKEGLEIKAVEHIDYEGSTDEDKRAEQVRDAIKKFKEKHKIANDRVLVALPGLHAFSRFIKLPPVDAKKIGMMVRMEAQQQIPFPIADVNWDFQKIERQYEPGEEVEVGIFATQRERITGFLKELQDNGIEPGVVTIAPLAIYNFMAYNADFGDDPVVVLDIGSDHTDLVVMSGPRFWIRNLRIAGNDITKSLADRFKVSFEEAEKLKRNASKSEQSKKIFSAMEGTLKDLVGEVHRSVGFFKSQAPGGELKISQMVLLGDGAKLKNLPTFFTKELGYPADKVQKLEQDKFVLDPDVDVEMLKKHLLGFGVALGLAIQGAGKAKCAINLAPEDIKINEELRRKVPWAAGAAGIAWLAFGLSFMTWSSWRDDLKATVKHAGVVDSFKTIQDGIKQTKADGEKLLDEMKPLRGLVQNRLLPLELIREIGKVMPKENGKVPTLTAEEKKLSLDEQVRILKSRREKDGVDNRLWVLDFQIEKKPAGPSANDPAKVIPEGCYCVTIKLARQLAPGADAQQVRTQMKNEFVKPLCDALKGAPYHLKVADKYGEPVIYLANNPTIGDEIMGSSVNLSQLDPSGGGQYKELFSAIAVDVKFEVGVEPPAAAPAAAPGGEQQGGK